MSFEIKVAFSTLAEAVAFLQAAGGHAQLTAAPSAAGNAEKPKAEPKPAAKEKAAATTSSEKAAESKPSSASTAAATVEAQSAGVKYEDLQKAVASVVALGDAGKTKLRSILDGFGIPTFKGSDEGIWADALAQVQAAHAELSGADASMA